MTRTEETFNLSILAKASRRAHSDRVFRRIAGKFLTSWAGEGVQGQPVHSDLAMVMRVIVALELVDVGAPDDFACRAATMMNHWVHRDGGTSGESFKGPGFLIVLRNGDAVPFRVRYMSRTEWLSNPKTLFDRVYSPEIKWNGIVEGLKASGTEWENCEVDDEDPKAKQPVSFVVMDLGVMATEVRERMNEELKQRDRESISVQQMLDAMTTASQVLEQIDAIEEKKNQKSK